jgi:tetratricopeptide (TPR) repeat protein
MATPVDSEGGVSPEIARLRAQLARDPGSKLFMPLAEEYLKAGMAGEAVSTLENGLNANPYYMSAKVLLGKAYLQSGDTGKAKEQFEAVVKAIPDNLLAHRKLGEIYLGMGMMAEAISSFRIITLLNPKDEEAKALLKEAESPRAAAPEAPAEEEPAVARVEDTEPEPQENAIFDISEISPTEEGPELEMEVPLPEDHFAEAYELPEPEPEFPALEVEDAHTAPDVFSEVEAIPEPYVLPETDDLPETDALPEMEAIEAESVPETAMEDEIEEPIQTYSIDATQTDVGDILSAYKEEAAEDEGHENPAGVYEINDDPSSFELDGFVYQAPKHEALPSEPGPGRKEAFETETLAELYVAQGFYDRAIDIYKNLIVESPADMGLKQKLEDLYLLANIGKRGRKEEAGEVLDAELAGDILPPWEDESPEADAMDSWEFYGEPGKRTEDSGERLGSRARSKNLEAVKRLERFLETIRRKAGK